MQPPFAEVLSSVLLLLNGLSFSPFRGCFGQVLFFPSFRLWIPKTVQRSALCRSRQELSNEYLLAKFGFDTAEDEPCKVCPLSAYRSPKFFRSGWEKDSLRDALDGRDSLRETFHPSATHGAKAIVPANSLDLINKTAISSTKGGRVSSFFGVFRELYSRLWKQASSFLQRRTFGLRVARVGVCQLCIEVGSTCALRWI